MVMSSALKFQQLLVVLTVFMTMVTAESASPCVENTVRLVNTSTGDNTQGMVEICANGNWDIICDNHWDAREARVVCRQLGFESNTAIAIDYAGAGRGPIHHNLDYLECTGTESDLTECSTCSYCESYASCNYTGVICYPNGTECNDTDIRLVGGENDYEGRVEICFRGLWGSVCGYHYRWWPGYYYYGILEDREAGVICRQLGFQEDGATISSRGQFGGSERRPIFLDNLVCSGREKMLSQCGHSNLNEHECWHETDVGVICPLYCTSGDVRLVDGESKTDGRVQLCHQRVWGSICDNHWDSRDATVVCRQLGYETDIAFATQYSKTMPIHRDYVNCSGNESSISECPSCPYCTAYYYTICVDAGVICYPNGTECNNTDIRLVGGDGRHEGRLEICYGGVWGSVCGKHWNWPNDNYDNIFLRRTVAAVVCRQLGLSPDGGMLRISEYGTPSEQPIFLDNTVCNGTEERLADCSHSDLNVHECWHEVAIGVACVDVGSTCVDGDVRLVGGQAPNEGRVEVCFNDQFGTICDNGWDQRDARTVCFQLGFSREDALAVRALNFGVGSGSIHIQGVSCNGNEDYITQCSHQGVGAHTCTHSQDAGVICKPYGGPQVCSDGDIRLRDGRDDSEGRVEICLNDHWGTVCNNKWGEQEAKVVCRQLGFPEEGSIALSAYVFGHGTSTILLDGLGCDGSEMSLKDCSNNPTTLLQCHHQTDAGVACNDINGTQCTDGDVRLVNGSSPYEGRVEVCFSNRWGTVCDYSWDHTDAAVVCRQLNITNGTAVALSHAFFGEGRGIIWFDDVDCSSSSMETGNPLNLLNCSQPGVDGYSCQHSNDASVICPLPDDVEADCENGIVRLVDGMREHEGRVEVCFNNRWGTICDNSWTHSNAEVVCRQLGLLGEDYIATTQAFFGQGDGPVYLDYVECIGNESTILECTSVENLGQNDCTHIQDAGVICPSTTLSGMEKTRNGDSFVTPGAVIGVVIAILLLGIGGLGFLINLCKQQKKKIRAIHQNLLMEEIVRNTNFESERNTYAHFQPGASNKPLDKNILLNSMELLDDISKEFLIPSSDIRLMDTLGQGEFGIVYKAHLIKPMVAPRQPESGDEQSSKPPVLARKLSRTATLLEVGATKPLTVAVKTLKGYFTEDDIKEMLRESNKMQQFDHPNVLSMMGICLDAGPAPYIVMPFMANGSLISYLKKDRPNLILPDDADEDTVSATRKRMTDMCLQVAKGMEYLASMKLIHRDLAARNCMIDSDWIIKVADFGLSESTSTKDYFRQNEGSSVKLPIKWMAPESLSDGVFSEKTDVWSYGVTCWEVYTAGMTPYRGVHPLDVVGMLDCGKRLEKPHNAACCDMMYSVMTSCWEFEPINRPHFSQLTERITKVLETLSDYLDVSTFQFSSKKEDLHSEPLAVVEEDNDEIIENESAEVD